MLDIGNKGEAIDYLMGQYPGEKVRIIFEEEVHLMLRGLKKVWLFGPYDTPDDPREEEASHWPIQDGTIIATDAENPDINAVYLRAKRRRQGSPSSPEQINE